MIYKILKNLITSLAIFLLPLFPQLPGTASDIAPEDLLERIRFARQSFPRMSMTIKSISKNTIMVRRYR